MQKQYFSAKRLFLYSLVLLLVAMSATVFADPLSLGTVSSTFLGPVRGATRLLVICSYILGGAFLAASVVRYFEYRRNPIEVRLSTVVFMFLLGLLLIGLPLIASYSAATKSMGQQQKQLPSGKQIPATPGSGASNNPEV